MQSLTQIKFASDLDKIATQLIASYGLKFDQYISNLSEPLLRWVDFRLRLIEPKPRKVVFSNKLPIKNLSVQVNTGLAKLEKVIKSGKDINPYQSKGLIKFNDTSGKSNNKRTDLLYADWNIHHLHITDKTIVKNEYFSARDCTNGEVKLLFCLILEDVVGYIDIKDHSDKDLFSDRGIIETAIKSWPEYYDQFRINGILPSGKQFMNSEISSLRNNGINAMLEVDNKIYSLGSITTASTPTKATFYVDKISRWIEDVADFVDCSTGECQSYMKSNGITMPVFSLDITPKGICVFEETTNTAFNFPKSNDNFFEFIFPSWMLNYKS